MIAMMLIFIMLMTMATVVMMLLMKITMLTDGDDVMLFLPTGSCSQTTTASPVWVVRRPWPR